MVEWQEALLRNSLKVNAKKKEVMVCIQGRVEAGISDTKKDRLKQVETLKFLSSMISENGGCEDGRHRVGAGWGKWREMSGIVCDKRMSIMLKVAVYKTVMRPVLMHGSDTLALRKAGLLLERTEMRMLRWMI